ALEEFLFEDRSGYCEHYAASFAILARACGVPARVVAGFLGGEWNKHGQFMVIRKQFAHAWNEVWIEDRGWVRIDATSVISPQRIEAGFNAVRMSMGRGLTFSVAGNQFEAFRPGWMPEWLSRPLDETTERWDQANAQWDDFLGYDVGQQLSIFQNFGLNQMASALVLTGSLILGIAFVLAWVFWIVFVQKQEDGVLKQYEMLMLYFRKRNLGPDQSEGAYTYLDRLQKYLDEANRDLLTQFRDLYLVLRYGKTPDKLFYSNALNQLKLLRKKICR
ncbi:MAG: transglutaminase domain-containing protein, partial [Verrucomicrobiota bacterium]